MISSKQRKILAFPYSRYKHIICDGAVRSGKTSIMSVAFIRWAMENFNGCRFGICGKTVGSAVQNIIVPLTETSYIRRNYSVNWRRSDKILVVKRGKVKNLFEVFGGRDESSFMLIQGRTLAGVLLDEVVLMPESFVNQALARCSVKGAKFWFSCNPDSPLHWFKKSWIDRAKELNTLYLHFAMTDNPSLDKETLDQYNKIYQGVFYQRYVLGEWCVAEGLVYNFGEDNITDEIPNSGEYYISIDYGTMNPFSAGLWCLRGDKAVRIKEYYYNGRAKNVQLTDEQYCDEVDKLANGYDIRRVVVDPSAASFITALRKRHYTVIQARNEVLDGIRRTAVYLESGNIKIHRSCGDTIREFGLYRWDEKATEDTVIKENDHTMDDIRYFANTILSIKTAAKIKRNSRRGG